VERAFFAAGGSEDAATVPFGFHCHCAGTTAQARAEAREPMERYVRTRLYAVQRPFDTLVEQEVVAFGDPDEITRVARLYERAGFTDFLAIPNFGGLPHKRVLRSMELMAKEVLPRFHPAGRAWDTCGASASGQRSAPPAPRVGRAREDTDAPASLLAAHSHWWD
jgi:alkanesulfonate monooxygenase SsuD/methylene tetrahydromethanopterin reductase-like flavin-dependent oxidoreductase (luciferase family)